MAEIAHSPKESGLPRSLLVSLLVLSVALLFSYWTTLKEMELRWRADAQYSHGYLVPLFAGYLLWARRDKIKWNAVNPSWWGAALLVLGCLIRLAGAFSFIEWFDELSLIPCIAGMVLLWGGWTAFRWSWPAIAFLVFMVPLPFSVEGKFAEQLQMLGTQCSTYSLQTVGYPAFAEGTDILVNQERVSVVKACSGLGMLMSFFALSIAVALVIDRPLLDRVVIVVSAVPIALLSNVARITFTSMLFDLTQNQEIRNWAHTGAGWFMMIFALMLMWLELKVLSLLFTQEDPKERMPLDVFDKPLAPKPAASGSKPPRSKKNAPIPVELAHSMLPHKKTH
jgi:exosortase